MEPYTDPAAETRHVSEIDYTHVTPCADCPFRRSVKRAQHDVVSFAKLIAAEGTEGRPAFTCHKSDPRAKGFYKPGYEGPLQHCAGLLHSTRGKLASAEMAETLGAADLTPFRAGHRDIIPWRELMKFTWDFADRWLAERRERRASAEGDHSGRAPSGGTG